MGKDIINKCCDLSSYCDIYPTTYDAITIRNGWRECFSLICKQMGFRKKDSKFLWNNLADGNWEHFHTTPEENERTKIEWLKCFSEDLFYCSDRWSFDRLTRVHWLFKHWLMLECGDSWYETL